jgi:3-oxoacyl-[acyl-carrier-protein] synthase III
MIKSVIKGYGYYVPENVVTNDDLSKLMTTNDEWITERTGIKERRHRKNRNDSEETTAFLAKKAAEKALEKANLTAKDLDFIVFATLSPDYFFPGSGVVLQEMLGCDTIGALDVRNQCSGFVYSMSVADAFIKAGTYKNVLVVGAEVHSFGLDFTDDGKVEIAELLDIKYRNAIYNKKNAVKTSIGIVKDPQELVDYYEAHERIAIPEFKFSSKRDNADNLLSEAITGELTK